MTETLRYWIEQSEHECDKPFPIGSCLACDLLQLERERDEAIRSCHIWQKGHAELVAERDYLLNLLQVNQPERKHIGRWGHNKEEFTSPYINK
jgi:hypothetical protein